MIRDVVTPQTTESEWPRIRDEIYARILASMATFPEMAQAPEVEYVDEAYRANDDTAFAL